MDAQEFIDAIRLVVVNATVDGIRSTLNQPPGRKPAKELTELSDWYHSLENKDKDMITRVIKETTYMAVFGFLCVLDGVTAIGGTGDKGELLLHFKKNGNSNLINDPDKEYLHDLFKAV